MYMSVAQVGKGVRMTEQNDALTKEGAAELEEQLARQKEIKVQIPMELYLKLHQNKIINGELLKDTVQEALDLYLEEFSTGETEESQKDA